MTKKLIDGRYRLERPMATGGMASIWKGRLIRDSGFERVVAIKRIVSPLAKNPRFTRMFAEEARVVSQIAHPNVVQVLDFVSDDDGECVLVMEWIEGVTLRQLARLGAVHWARTAAVAIETLRGLSAAHRRRDEDDLLAPIIHRDLSPENVIIDEFGNVKLIDFGLARAMDRTKFTPPNFVKGKLSYLAPEMLQGREATVQSDLYAVGAIMWELLAGRRLHFDDDPAAIVDSIRVGAPPIATIRQEVPRSICEIVDKALCLEPSERYTHAMQMARALSDALRVTNERTDAPVLATLVRDVRSQAMSERPEALASNDLIPVWDPASDGEAIPLLRKRRDNTRPNRLRKASGESSAASGASGTLD